MKKYTFYVIRILRDSSETNIKFGNCKPCAECTKMLKKYQIRKIYYTNCEGSFVKSNVRDLESDHMSRAQKEFRHNVPCCFDLS